MQVATSDLAAMRTALVEARLALDTGDVPVGAVVLGGDGALLGVGRNRREADADPTAHAEIVALRAAAATSGSWRLEGATLAVTLEPCTMCAGAIVNSRVARLLFGADDPKAGAVGSECRASPRRRAAKRVRRPGVGRSANRCVRP